MKKDLHFAAFVPEYDTKHNANNNSHEESDSIVLRVSPVRPVLFPKTSLTLGYKGLRVLGGEVKVL